MNPENRSILPPMAFRSFASRYVKPALSEGFQVITDVDFVVGNIYPHLHSKRISSYRDQFEGTPEQRLVWSQYWVSKFTT